MSSSDLKLLLGRYEYKNEETNADKFWTCTFDATTKTYTTSWGRSGCRAQYKKGLSDGEAYAKIAEKLGKGYMLIDVQFQNKSDPFKVTKKKAARKITPTEKDETFEEIISRMMRGAK